MTAHFDKIFDLRLRSINLIIENEQKKIDELRSKKNELSEFFNRVYNSYINQLTDSIKEKKTQVEIVLLSDANLGENTKYILEHVNNYFESEVKKMSGVSIVKKQKRCKNCPSIMTYISQCSNCDGKNAWIINVY